MPGSELYEKFMALHTRDGGLVMPNAWDGLSALMLADAGFEAIATSSAALAATLGRLDGRHEVTREEHLEHARLLGRLTGLPVNGDFEDGYGDTPEDVAATVEAAVEFGLAGIGVEDTSGNPDQPIRDFDEAVNRIRSAVDAAKGRIVVTGRTDNFIQGRPDLDDTIRRLTAFAEVGADVLYAPFPPDLDALVAIVTAVAPTPVNVLVSPSDKVLTVAELQKAGVKRISLGPFALHPRDGGTRTGHQGARRGRPRLGDDRYQLRAHQRTACPRQELAQTLRTTAPHPLIARRRQIDMDLDKLMSKHLTRYFRPQQDHPGGNPSAAAEVPALHAVVDERTAQPLLRPRHARRQRAARGQPGRTIPGQRREDPERVAHHHPHHPGRSARQPPRGGVRQGERRRSVP